MADKIIEISRLKKAFGENSVLKDISFSVEKGDVISIIGPSGSGKSTLLRCVNFLETPSGGEIFFHGKPVDDKELKLTDYRARVGMVFQSFNLFDNMTVLKNCTAGQKIVLKRSEEEAKKIGAVDFLAQGTIYPDVVESGLGGESAVIKSHHNVGGLPDYVDFKEIIEPLRNLFKDEVRKAGLELGIPEKLVFRQPFPGPGLGIRIIGEVTAEKVRIVQDADAIYREEIANAGLDRSIGQYFAALTNMRSVGVMGDERTYDYAVALRAVNTVDFMTAEAADIPFDVLQTVMSRIINEVRGVNRVFYDLTSKPPGTIEFE